MKDAEARRFRSTQPQERDHGSDTMIGIKVLLNGNDAEQESKETQEKILGLHRVLLDC